MYFLYILLYADETLYTGITTDVQRRFKEHQQKKGGHYTRAHGVSKILYSEECGDRSNALKREVAVKRLSRNEKLTLIAGNK